MQGFAGEAEFIKGEGSIIVRTSEAEGVDLLAGNVRVGNLGGRDFCSVEKELHFSLVFAGFMIPDNRKVVRFFIGNFDRFGESLNPFGA